MKKFFTCFLAALMLLTSTLTPFALAEGETTPPPLPSGEMGQGGMGTPPDGNMGNPPSGDMGNPPSGDMGNPPSGGMGTPPDGMGGAPGSNSAPSSYAALISVSTDTDLSGESLQSEGTDENAVHLSSGTLTADGLSITRFSSDSTGGDASSFYGVGACLLATGGEAMLNNVEIHSSANGGAGLFALGEGKITVEGGTITTDGDSSGGVHVAGGGTLVAKNLTVITAGVHSAAIRSDRGGGTMEITGGSYLTTGTDSPAVYVTADITVNSAELNAQSSEGVCIEGKNSLKLEDCSLVCNMPVDGRNETTWSIILYQSMSGDSEVGKSVFSMEGGSITSYSGGLLYTTNTQSEMVLKDVNLCFPEGKTDYILRCTGNGNSRGWGQTGSNGAQCSFTAIGQQLPGDVVWDSASTLSVALTEGSCLTGAVVLDNSYAGNAAGGSCNVSIDAASTWVVTGNSQVSSLDNQGKIVDEAGRSVTLLDGNGKVIFQGDSEYTVTVG